MSSIKIYRTNDLAKLFQVSRQTIFLWRKSGKLPAPQKIASIPYWTQSQIESFLNIASSNADSEDTALEAINV